MSEEIEGNYQRYLERINLFKSFGYDIQAERDFILEKALPLQGEILEVGTGKGHFAIALAQKGYRFTCVDVSEEEQKYARMNIEYLKLQDHVEFKISNAEQLDFDDGSFDIIFAINMVHHLSEPYKVMDEFTRVIKLGGKIIVSDFNEKGMELVGKIHKGEGRIHPEGTTTLKEIDAYLAKKGFMTKKYETDFQKTVIAHWFNMGHQ